jgi:hypothetical protein
MNLMNKIGSRVPDIPNGSEFWQAMRLPYNTRFPMGI